MKILKTVALSASLLTVGAMASDTNSTEKTAHTTKATQAKADGFYLGVGGGVTFNISVLSTGYYYDESTGTVYNTKSLSDNSAGFIGYAGYQFNKIIAVEAAYTDYGSFSDSVNQYTFTSDPVSISVYANAGYTFGNGLRPFGQIGLGYVMINGSNTTQRVNIDDSASFRFGLGVEYAPAKLNGFGFRLAYIEDVTMDGSYTAYDNVERTTLMMGLNGMLYVGAQYKF